MEVLAALLNGLAAGVEAAIEAWLSDASAILVGLAWVATGSAIGGGARFLVSGVVGRAVGETFPWGTVVVNATGAFAVGGAAAVAATQPGIALGTSWHLGVLGFLGSYTTVSSLSLQTLVLARDGQLLRAAGNVCLSVALCLAVVALGSWAALAAIG